LDVFVKDGGQWRRSSGAAMAPRRCDVLRKTFIFSLEARQFSMSARRRRPRSRTTERPIKIDEESTRYL
jgi:hypothetical protein